MIVELITLDAVVWNSKRRAEITSLLQATIGPAYLLMLDEEGQRFISDIRALGCTVCLDDFGVGFPSFVYLKHLSANILKIDGLFGSKEDQVLDRAIAEFLGDAGTLRLIGEMGIDYAQGFYLSRPFPEICPA